MVVLLQIPLLLLVYLLICLCGLTAYAYYELQGCDPYRSYQVSNTNQLLPYFLVDAIRINGLTGLFVAVLFSGALSSISSSMNSLAAITWKDILEKPFSGLDETRRTIVTKATALIYGVVGVLLGFVMKFFRGNVMQLATVLLSGLNGPLAGVIIAGSIFPWVHGNGMIVGVLSGLGVFLWINIGQYITYPHRSYLETNVENCSFAPNETARVIEEDPDDIFWVYKLSFLYVPLASLLTTIFAGLIASLIMGKQDPTKLDPQTMVNLSDRCGCCCRKSCEDKCTCGVPYGDLDDDEEKVVYTEDGLKNGVVLNMDDKGSEMNGNIGNKNDIFQTKQDLGNKDKTSKNLNDKVSSSGLEFDNLAMDDSIEGSNDTGSSSNRTGSLDDVEEDDVSNNSQTEDLSTSL